MCDSHFYTETAELPAVTEQEMAMQPPFVVHVGKLGFDICCSLKPFPGNDVGNALVEQYTQDGFLTSGDPLLVLQPSELLTHMMGEDDSHSRQLAPFSLGYLKGMARTGSLHALLIVCWKNDLDIKANNSKLFNSIQLIHCHFRPHATKLEEGLSNLKLSVRGSIRKMSNVVQLAITVEQLNKYGLRDFGVFVRRWNQMSGRSHQILGKKALALKYLFDLADKESSTII